MQCPNYDICKRWHEANVHPGREKFVALKKLGTCASLEYMQCLYLWKMHNPKVPVLIVEDENKIRENLSHMVMELYSDNMVVYHAENYTEGIFLLEKKYFPIALLDIRLPDGSGMQLLDDIQRISPATIVVMITAFDKFTELMDHAREKGAAECLGKPFSYNEIREVLDKYIPFIYETYASGS